jgi:hypothetical protein
VGAVDWTGDDARRWVRDLFVPGTVRS